MVDRSHNASYVYLIVHRIKSNSVEGKGNRALKLAELIIENSPSILFRRLAADDPKQRKMVISIWISNTIPAQ